MNRRKIEARNPRWNQQGTIDLDVDLPGDGWCPFTAHPSEGQYGPELYRRALAGEFGEIAPYVAPPPTRAELLSAARQRVADAYRVAPPADPAKRMEALEIVMGLRDPELGGDEERGERE
jgi:hypothetical protein